MNVLLISLCTKKAREETCRVIDQFAERMGSGTWQTIITLEGVTTLRKLLRKTARRNTAVACHWLKKNGQTELMWIVGNPRRFNSQGRVPTNRTSRPIWKSDDGGHWQSIESVALLAAIAGLFHDFGKSGRYFQDSLTGKSHKSYQPYRHEWISLRLFQAFVGEQNDTQWLNKLGDLSPQDEIEIFSRLYKDSRRHSNSPFISLPPLARVVAWLILSHHRLPEMPTDSASFSTCQHWIDCQLNADWNALNHRLDEWDDDDFYHVWTFPAGTPIRSKTWREKARQITKRAKKVIALAQWATMDQLFVIHMARFCLMLADHFYSASEPQPHWQDNHYRVWANSDRISGALKQQVDEHLVGVAHHALLLGRQLNQIRISLPAITRHKGFRERAANPLFQWQNRAWDTALALRERSREAGFFGVNMASTGCGKTFANARIMYALSDEQEGCRFTVALGLRTLTLQTGDALRSRLHLDDDDLAVMVGSNAVKHLWQLQTEQEADNNSASAYDLIEQQQYVHYEGSLQSGVLDKWLNNDPKLRALVSAPVLVTTIDHLIPATEGVRGGKQLPAMLRLLTSDLVLDEPDDFDINDLHAICRLMNWAGMLGTRVLLSSATLPPDLIQSLFAAYLAGRKIWQSSCGDASKPLEICCAWFDERQSHVQPIADGRTFSEEHTAFVARRAKMLQEKPRLHFGRIADVCPQSTEVIDIVDELAQTIRQQILALHREHHNLHDSGKTVSLGLVRFANINPLVAVSKALIALPSPDNTCIHYCVYHARHPLAIRSAIEKCLDQAFTRHQADAIWLHPDINDVLKPHREKNHIFVVLGTSVMEVGRDWDADWGIIEPSSMRSIIQFAGRVQRHRRKIPDNQNIVILSHNYKALRNQLPAFSQPGFETHNHALPSHNVHDLLPTSDYQNISALSRILPPNETNLLASLEHQRLREALLSSKGKQLREALLAKKVLSTAQQKMVNQVVAADWWRESLTWTNWLQRKTPFRQSAPDRAFFLREFDEGKGLRFAYRSEQGDVQEHGTFIEQDVDCAKGVMPWGVMDYNETFEELADQLQQEMDYIGEVFGEVNVPAGKDDAISDWNYHPWLGVFRAPS